MEVPDPATHRYARYTKYGGVYLRRMSDERRTRVYTTLEAATRAVQRGELYTDAEYAALTAPSVGAAPRRPIKVKA